MVVHECHVLELWIGMNVSRILYDWYDMSRALYHSSHCHESLKHYSLQLVTTEWERKRVTMHPNLELLASVVINHILLILWWPISNSYIKYERNSFQLNMFVVCVLLDHVLASSCSSNNVRFKGVRQGLDFIYMIPL